MVKDESPLAAWESARASDDVADGIAERVGEKRVSPGRWLRLGGASLGAAVLLPGVLVLLGPGGLESWPVVAFGALFLVAGVGVSLARPWGAPLAALAGISLALRAGATTIEHGVGVPLVAWALFIALATGAIFFRRVRRLHALRGHLGSPEAFRASSTERAREGPGLVRALAAVLGVYATFAIVAFVYHHARGVEAPIGIGIRGRDLPALAVRTALQIVTILVALLATRGRGGPPVPVPERLRDVGRGILLFLGTFAVLTAISSLMDIVSSFRATGTGELVATFKAGLERETARATSFDPMLFAYAAILAPVGEELIFRWTLHRGLRTRMPFIAAALLQAVLFALLHSYRFALYQTLLIGLVFAWSVERTRRILPAMVGHGLWNGLQSLG